MALNSKQQMFWTNEKRKLSDLKPWERNPRQIKDKQAKLLAESFSDFGQVETIAISANGDIYNGHQRLSVLAGKYGMDYEIDVRVSSRDLTEKERERLTVYLHRGATGEWDYAELANWDMSELLTWGFEEGDFPFDVAPAVEAGTDTEPQIDKAEELRQKWNVETGQMWQLGEHRIICGDCTDKAVVDRVMGGEKADLLLTDPPYGMSLETDTTGRIPTSPLPGKDRGLHAHSKVIGDDKPFDRTSVLLDAKEEFWWGGDYYVDTLPNSGKDGSWIVWDKRKEGTLDEMRGNSFELCWSKTKHKRELIRVTWIGVLGHDKKNDGELKFHPTQKSVKLIQCIVSDYSKMDDIVADPFSGSGTTLIACQNLSRKCRAVEISPAYVAVAIQRWADHTGQEPVLIDNGK
jgi:DNA modification methylase